MPQRPVTFWIQSEIEIWTIRSQQLRSMEAVIAQQPVCLVEPVFPQQRWWCADGRKGGVVIQRDVGGIEYTFQIKILIECLRSRQNLKIRFTSGTDDHLGTLAGGGKGTIRVTGNSS